MQHKCSCGTRKACKITASSEQQQTGKLWWNKSRKILERHTHTDKEREREREREKKRESRHQNECMHSVYLLTVLSSFSGFEKET
jgi:hypothetical protein